MPLSASWTSSNAEAGKQVNSGNNIEQRSLLLKPRCRKCENAEQLMAPPPSQSTPVGPQGRLELLSVYSLPHVVSVCFSSRFAFYWNIRIGIMTSTCSCKI